MTPTYQTLLTFALNLAREAEREILPRFRNVAISYKSDGSEVTEADRGAEGLMRSLIEKEYPGHAILGEELGATGPADAEYRWILDPVDGTGAFTLGMPLFGTLIGLLRNRKPVVGVVHFPAMQETLYAARGSGCWHRNGSSNPVKVRVSKGVSLGEATITTTGIHSSDVFTKEGEVPYRLSHAARKAKKLRFGGDCYLYNLLCQGRTHAVIEPIMNPWDVAALIPCIEEAGGIVSTMKGEEENVVFGGSLLASCHPGLHRELLETVRP